MYDDDDTDIDINDATQHSLRAIPPRQTNGNDRVSWASLGSPCWPSLPAAPSRPLYRLVQREGGNAPVGYSVLSEIADTIRRTSERLARWRSGQRELRCMRARRLQLEQEEWEA